MINYKIIIVGLLTGMRRGKANVLYISAEMIQRHVTMKELIDGIDQAYAMYVEKNFTLPTRTQVQDSNNTLVLMPCITETYMTTKLVTVFPENKDIPTIHGLVVVNCNQTGQIKALIDGSYLTGVRTGAIGGSAVRHLARQDATKLAVIGAGVQGYFQTLAACEERNFTEINVYSRTRGKKLAEFVRKLKNSLPSHINVNATNSATEAIRDADVIITATNSYEPVLPNDRELFKQKLIVAVGSFQPNMRELPEAVYHETKYLLMDTDDAALESGDIIIPLEKGWLQSEQVATLADFIAKEKTIGEDETVIFKSTGSALFDAVSAAIVYEKVLQEGAGLSLT